MDHGSSKPLEMTFLSTVCVGSESCSHPKVEIFPRQCDFAIPSFGYRDANTVVIPKFLNDASCGAQPHAWSLLEFFSGGFGGWKQSALIMNKLHNNWNHTLAVEIEHYIARMYCKNFNGTCYDQSDPSWIRVVILRVQVDRVVSFSG